MAEFPITLRIVFILRPWLLILKTETIVLIELKTKSLDGVGPVALVSIDRMDIDKFIC